MKTIYHLHLVVALLVLLSGVSCSFSDENLDVSVLNKDSDWFRKNNTVTRGDMLSYEVTSEDIEAYIKYKALASKDESFEVKYVIPFPDEDNPALYAIIFNDYWELISTDKRTAPVIASGEGIFNQVIENNNLLSWIHCLADEVSVLKETDAYPKNADQYLQFWRLIKADKDLVQTISLPTRSEGPDTLDHPVPGHYEIIDLNSYETVISSINHLIQTKWGQTYPFNKYCPRDSSEWIPYHGHPRCHAGCIPVAAGQLVYYYHYESDSSPEVYDSAFCYTREDSLTNWSLMGQYNKSSSNWSKFQTNDSLDMAAVMLANIGQGVHIKYHYGATGLPTIEPIVDCLFDEYDLECYYDHFYSLNFNMIPYDYIYSLLVDGYPSMLAAFANYVIVSPGDTLFKNGHAFIVDRYKNSYITNEYTFHFVADDPTLPDIVEDVFYVETLPTVRYFGMNWGWTGQGDDTWCVSSGDWVVCVNNVYNFRYKKEMITFLSDGSYPPGPGLEELINYSSNKK